MKRLCTCLLVLVMCLSLTPAALGAGATFSDVLPGHWAHKYVEPAAQMGWVTGVGDGRYDPDGDITGAQFITMVVRAFYPGDIPSGVADPWYQPYLTVAQDHNLLDGRALEEAEDLMTAPLSRYQMALIMSNVLTDAGVHPAISFDPSMEIADWDYIPADYQLAVARAFGLGLLTGYDGGIFAGAEKMTRAQAAAVMCRLDELVPVQSPGADPVTPADMVSNEVLLQTANTRLSEQYYFLYGLRAGAVFQQAWGTPLQVDGRAWDLVTEPGVDSLADIQTVWETYFARAWVIPQEYLQNYRDINGRLYSANQGIGDDVGFQKLQAEEVISRKGNNASLRAFAYYDYSDFGTGEQAETVEYRCDMLWEDGQWKCCGLFLV